MSRIAAFLHRLAGDRTGAALVETAVVAPVLLTMCVGGVEVSTMIAKQGRLQGIAEQATEITLVATPETDDERSDIEEELEAALPATATVNVEYRYRCGTGTLTTSAGTCDEDQLATYIRIKMTDSYTPTWANFGIGSAFTYDVERMVQVS